MSRLWADSLELGSNDICDPSTSLLLQPVADACIAQREQQQCSYPAMQQCSSQGCAAMPAQHHIPATILCCCIHDKEILKKHGPGHLVTKGAAQQVV